MIGVTASAIGRAYQCGGGSAGAELICEPCGGGAVGTRWKRLITGTCVAVLGLTGLMRRRWANLRKWTALGIGRLGTGRDGDGSSMVGWKQKDRSWLMALAFWLVVVSALVMLQL